MMTPVYDRTIHRTCSRARRLHYAAGWLKAISSALIASFYCAMHYSAMRGIAIACRPSVCLSVCNVGGSGPHRLKIFGN